MDMTRELRNFLSFSWCKKAVSAGSRDMHACAMLVSVIVCVVVLKKLHYLGGRSIR